MSLTLLAATFLTAAISAIAALVTLHALLRAPVGIETEDGFQFVPEHGFAPQGTAASHSRYSDGLAR